ncbi:MAG: DUF393 domain-containing protein, partial [Bacteroidia bacterium]|nr:DUF393 domain-containing protein [Bacteroidia bacterium]
IILFDGSCNLCNGAVAFIYKRDAKKAFCFTPLRSSEGKELLKQAGVSKDYNQSIVYLRKGKPYFKSTAALLICKDIGGVWSFFYFFIVIPRFVRDAVYKLISLLRYKLSGKRKNCIVPTTEIKSL